MKISQLTLLASILFLSFHLNAQNKWTVLAGGTPDAGTPDPYYSPSQLTIQIGDTVVWNNIQGWHNITMTSGPEDFSFGPAGSGWTHEFVFTQSGSYSYECSVGTHALTQFGTINVIENQTKYTIIAGGTPDTDTPDPYYSPNRLTIQSGDTVVWNNIQGWHNITMTSGPEDFSFGPAGSDWTHEFVFMQSGSYNYECSVGDHALTQFGTINVEGVSVSTNNIIAREYQAIIYPNPASSRVQVDWEKNYNSSSNLYIIFTDILGKEVNRILVSPDQNKASIDLSQMKRGVYSVSLRNRNKTFWNLRLINL